MTRKVTRWSPDTCDCTIDYEWDAEASSEERVHTPVAAQPCKYHKKRQVDHTTIHAVVVVENQKKNQASNLVVEHLASLGIPTASVRHEYDAVRTLHLHVADLTDEHQASLQSHLAANGHGDVVIHG